ncbi:MAG: cytochrome c3 family protein [Lentisphaeria bacterium]|nr:cytochrome c family protein [Lentisphaeria bacterium]NQZ66728.1 cytochrome c3 family protein [Lentisphaeria bacterium]
MAQIFPKWMNLVPFVAAVGGGGTAVTVILCIWWFGSPEFTDVGYRPEQPIPFSHKLHAGELGMDCRYCHSNIEKSQEANIPAASTCMNCHRKVKMGSKKLDPLYNMFEHKRDKPTEQDPQGKVTEVDFNKPKNENAIEWVRVHKLPDYAYFDHSVHLKAGVGCTSCHGRIDGMEVVYQAKPLSMGWCLDCHRKPQAHIRPDSVKVTDMNWLQKMSKKESNALIEKRGLKPPEDCSACHR